MRYIIGICTTFRTGLKFWFKACTKNLKIYIILSIANVGTHISPKIVWFLQKTRLIFWTCIQHMNSFSPDQRKLEKVKFFSAAWDPGHALNYFYFSNRFLLLSKQKEFFRRSVLIEFNGILLQMANCRHFDFFLYNLAKPQ